MSSSGSPPPNVAGVPILTLTTDTIPYTTSSADINQSNVTSQNNMTLIMIPTTPGQVLPALWLLFLLAALFLSLRIYTKIKTHRGLWWDDYLLIICGVLLLAHVSLVTAAIALGFGALPFSMGGRMVDQRLVTLLTVQIAQPLGVMTRAFGTTSWGFTLHRITLGWIRASSWFMIASLDVLFIIFTVFTIVGYEKCTPAQNSLLQNSVGACWPASVSQPLVIFVGAYSAFADFLLAVLPVSVIMRLQINLKEKIGVAVAMSLGLISGAMTIGRTVQLVQISEGKIGNGAGLLYIWSTAEISTVIIATSIPVLRPLLKTLFSSLDSNHYGPRTKTFAAENMSRPSVSRRHVATVTANVHNQPGNLSHYVGGVRQNDPKNPSAGNPLQIHDMNSTPRGIMRTAEVSVVHSAHALSGRGWSGVEYEMAQIRQDSYRNQVV